MQLGVEIFLLKVYYEPCAAATQVRKSCFGNVCYCYL